MKIKSLQEKLDNILIKRMERFYSIEQLLTVYKDLINLKEEIIKFGLVGLTNSEIEELDYIRFRVLEELYLVEIDIRHQYGIDTEKTEKELKSLYGVDVKC